eukprot:g30807.t1
MSQWEVVGGSDKGGILVRKGQDLKSEQCTDRLSTGALVARDMCWLGRRRGTVVMEGGAVAVNVGELNNNSKDRKKEALKKVIQAMTVGSDVSSLFPDVVNCMQTNSLDLKNLGLNKTGKLVYLYVINYAKAQPDLAILAIHSFRKEWGQVFILDALAIYDPPNSKVAEAILEKGVVATLHHHNSAVVLSAIKVIMKFMDRLNSQELVRSICRKMTPPLLTMLSAEPEIQYAGGPHQPDAWRDVNAFTARTRGANDYNDPLYVKLEKIAVMVQLASERNIDQVLSEFREYASEAPPAPRVDRESQQTPKPRRRFAMCVHRWKESERPKGPPKQKKEKKSYSHLAMVKRGERPKIKRLKWKARCIHGHRAKACAICRGCPHGRLPFRCPECRGSCPHGLFVRRCTICSGCEHGVLRDVCTMCTSRGCKHGLVKSACRLCTPCPHGRLKGGCLTCNGCPHGRLRQNCASCKSCPHGKVREHCHGCPHGKLPRFCPQCQPCEHGKDRAHCPKCAGCPHGKLPHNCKLCSGCPHGRVKRFCGTCNPCPHGRRKQNCPQCKTCEHGKLRDACSECKGCPHGKIRRFCGTCNPCPHGRLKQACRECTACEHGKVRNSCSTCNGCPHGKVRRFCGRCNPCPHGEPKQSCKQCNSCPHGKRRASCAECNGCPHGKVRRLCAVDITVVRHSVRAIGQAAIKIDRAAERCVDCLLELIKTKVNYVVQEAIVVIRDIFRKYPGKYEIIISDLCENLDSLDEPDAKAAMVWIVGEYAERIDNSGDLLESFLESFHEEPAAVQNQILTATVKMFLKCPQSSKQLVGRVLKLCTDESTNPDLRDRGYMYWRMLGKSPEMAKQVVLCERPTISENPFAFQPRVLDRLVANISTLASVYHQVPEAFCDTNRRHGATVNDELEGEEDYAETLERVQEEIQQTAGKTYEEESGDEESEERGGRSSWCDSGGNSGLERPLFWLQWDKSFSPRNHLFRLDCLLPSFPLPTGRHPPVRRFGQESGSSSGSEATGRAPSSPTGRGGTTAPAGGSANAGAPPPPLRPLAQVLSEQTRGQQGKTGLRVAAAVVRGQGGAVGMQLMVGNFSPQGMSGWAVQMNKNPFGLAPAGPLQLKEVPPNGTGKALLPLTPNQLLSGAAPSMPLYLEVAIKTNVDVFYLNVGYDLSAVLVDSGPMPKDAFQRLWQAAPADKKAMCQGAFGQKVSAQMVSTRMQQYYCFLVAQTQAQDMDLLYFNCSTSNKLNVYCELSLQRAGTGVRAVCCSEQQVMIPLFQSFLSELLQVKWQQGGPPSAGTKVEELKLVGDRLHYKRLTGTGPDEGWVSTKISGKELVVKKEVDEALKAKVLDISKAKKDDFLLYCMKYKASPAIANRG